MGFEEIYQPQYYILSWSFRDASSIGDSRLEAQARNPYSLRGLWIPGSLVPRGARYERPGMAIARLFRFYRVKRRGVHFSPR